MSVLRVPLLGGCCMANQKASHPSRCPDFETNPGVTRVAKNSLLAMEAALEPR